MGGSTGASVPARKSIRHRASRARWAVAVVGGLLALVALVTVAATVPAVRDGLAVVMAIGLVVTFFGVRLVAYRLDRAGADAVFDFWGGMTETTDQLLARYGRPGANPILPPDGPPGSAGLPDIEPTAHGHPLGRGESRPGLGRRGPR